MLTAAIFMTAGAAQAASLDVPAGGSSATSVVISGTDTVTVGAGATLAPTDTTPIVWDWGTASPNVVIDNSGTITTDDGTAVIGVTGTGNTNIARVFTLDNRAGGKITTDWMTAISMSGNFAGTIVINNAGEISAKNGQAINLKDLRPAIGSTVVINNLEGGLIIANAGQDVLRPGNKTVVNNAGTIIHRPDVNSGNVFQSGGDAVDFQDMRGSSLNNLAGGYIEGSRHGATGKKDAVITNAVGATIKGRNGSGINWDNEDADIVTITNYGKVIGTAVVNAEDGDGDGIDVDGQLVLDNYGEVIGEQAYGFHNGQLNSADGIAAGGGTIHNYAGGRIYGQDRGILIDDSDGGTAFFDTTLTNEGTVEADDGAAVTFVGDRNDTVTNKGIIRGGTDVFGNHVAIDMGGGNDTLNIYGGSSIDGQIIGGAGGLDTINLYGGTVDGGTLGNVRTVEWLNVASGSWTLTDDQVYDGINVDSDATLVSDHLLRGNLYLYGRAEGTATVTALTIDNSLGGGVLAPGGDGTIGTFTVEQTAYIGGTLEIDVNAAGESDKLVAGGQVNVSSAMDVEVNAAAGNYATETVYTIVSAGEINYNDPSWTNVSDNFAFLDSSLSGDASNIYLSLVRNDVSFFSVANTPNQQAVAEALMAEGGSALYGTVVPLSEEEAVEGFDQLSGDAHGNVASAAVGNGTQVQASVNDRIDAAFQALGLQSGGPLGYSESDAATADDMGLNVWADGVVQYADVGSDGSAAGYTAGSGGVLFGADRAVDSNWIAGLFGGFGHTAVDVADRDAEADIDSFTLGAYAGGTLDAVGLKFGGVLTGHAVSTTRNVVYGGVDETLTADYGASTVQGFAEASYALALTSALTVKPLVGLGYLGYNAEGFEEEGGLAALTSNGTSYDVALLTVGAQGNSQFVVGEGMLVNIDGMVAWQHTASDGPTSEMAFAAGNPFTVAGAPIAADALVLKAGLSVDVNEALALGASYGGQLSSEAQSHSLKASISGKF